MGTFWEAGPSSLSRPGRRAGRERAPGGRAAGREGKAGSGRWPRPGVAGKRPGRPRPACGARAGGGAPALPAALVLTGHNCDSGRCERTFGRETPPDTGQGRKAEFSRQHNLPLTPHATRLTVSRELCSVGPKPLSPPEGAERRRTFLPVLWVTVLSSFLNK